MRRFLLLVQAFVIGLLLTGCSLQPAQGRADTGGTGAKEHVVLIHGLARGSLSMWLLAHRLERAGYGVTTLDYHSVGETPAAVLAEAFGQIDACCAGGDRTVHFVGHSLGGLVIRAYLASHKVEGLGRVVLIGTPNAGTPLVDHHRDTWWMGIAGATAASLGTGPDSLPRSLPPPTYPVGVIAGATRNGFFSDLIRGEDDGLVPVESTKLPVMTDFVVVDSGHSMMRYDANVARQAIAFLKKGRFDHGSGAGGSP
jgi:hypothetical protein